MAGRLARVGGGAGGPGVGTEGCQHRDSGRLTGVGVPYCVTAPHGGGGGVAVECPAPTGVSCAPPQELEESRLWGGVRDLRPVEGNVLRWGGLLLPNNPPYNVGAFRFELIFSPHHPLEPPRATLRTPIYHPAVDPEGRVCQPLTAPQHWAPTTRALQVLQDLVLLLERPDPQRVLRPDLARELRDHPERFLRRAGDHARRHAESRPPDLPIPHPESPASVPVPPPETRGHRSLAL
ncbi:ubiquitin-conjugating enzyme E2-18 kDa-like [Aegotheles albertisi]